jgi:hypothetical protein
MVARRLGLAVLVVVCVVVGVLGLAVSSVSAFETRPFEASFGPDGTSSAFFPEPAPLAFDQSAGSLYVGSTPFGEWVEKFDAAHEPEPFTGVSSSVVGGRLTGLGSYFELAVDSRSVGHDLFVANESGVRAFQSDGVAASFTAGPGNGTNEIAGSEVCGVAVDQNGAIYVSEFSSGVHVYAPTGEPLTTLATPGLCELAVDSHGSVYATATGSSKVGQAGPVQKFTASEPVVTAATTYEAKGVVDETPVIALAVDPATDHLLLDENSLVAEYDESGVRLGTFGGTEPGMLPPTGGRGAGVAVNGVTGQVFVAQGNYEGQVEVFGHAILVPDVTTEPASQIDPKGSATLNGRVKPDGVALTECEFEYVDGAHYQPQAVDPYAAGATVQCVPAAGGIPSSGETSVSAQITSLTPGETYHFRLRAANANGHNEGGNQSFQTPALPAVHGETVVNVTATTADLQAEVNPRGSLQVTACLLEWGVSVPYEHSAPCEQTVGSGTADVPVSRHIADLEANKTYHWRLLATNAAGTTTGVDHTFIYDTSGEGLPDNRAYEMVTPPRKNGAVIGGFFALPTNVSEDGSRVVASEVQCFGGSQSCTANRGNEGEPFLFSRTPGGWVTTALAPPATRFESSSSWLASADTGEALFSMPTPPMLEDDFYVRRAGGSFVDIGPGTPPSAGPRDPPWSYLIQATADFSRIVFKAGGFIWPFTHQVVGETLYEYSGVGHSAPALVGVSGGSGSTDLISECETTGTGLPGALSNDGETVYFTAIGPCTSGTEANKETPVPVNELFARIGGRTQAISEPQAPQIQGGPGPRAECSSEECVKNTESPAPPATNPNWRRAEFRGASDDGSTAFFMSEQQLTDGASEGSSNLYESQCASPCGKPSTERHLIDVSEGAKEHGGPQVRGVMAISTDGSHVYFVARGVLGAAPNAQGATAQDGANNLYVFGPASGHPQGQVAFVTQIEGGQWEGRETANVTPDGRFLVFASGAKLTADDTRTDGTGQIFRYDAQTGVLVRVSVGEHGFNDNGNAGAGSPSFVPAFLGEAHPGATRSDPTMSHDGRFVFFTSPVGLTPNALNDVQIGSRHSSTGQSEPVYAENVYEWSEGQVYLISDGRDTAEGATETGSAVSLYGADGSGSNVFFTTADQLASGDADTSADVYDARICTEADPCVHRAVSLPPCGGEACHGIPAAQQPALGGDTLTFNGQGNVSEPSVKTVKAKNAKRKRPVRCAKGKRRAHGRCVKAKGGKARKSRSHRGGK